MVWDCPTQGFKEEDNPSSRIVKKATMKTTNRKPPLTANAILKALSAELEKVKSGPERERMVEPSEPASLMAQTSVDRVALVAAQLSRPDLQAHECVIKAYEIIHWASVGHGFLMGNPHPRINRWTALVIDYISREQSGEMAEGEKSALSHVEWDENYKPIPLAYLKGIEAIDPKGDRTTKRVLRIKECLIATGKVKNAKEANAKLAAWKKSGIPFMEFDSAFYSFRVFMKQKTSSSRASARKGEVEKEKKPLPEIKPKAKRRRVRKKEDKRSRSKYDGIVGKGHLGSFDE